ncbi:MAG TPA: hypothetical protein VMZ74_04610 [Ramlibacter sp.]|nr:hypothetical protein [Ramlibacter sp.]
MQVNDSDEPLAPPTRRETLVPAMAVAAVAAVAVAAAVMVKRADDTPQAQSQVAQRAVAPAQTPAVIAAPPLKAPATNSMGGAPACSQCGVVQVVVAVYGDSARKEPRGYQMHVRMDDGSVRTVEQRGALAAGSRVVVEGNSVKPMS